MRWFFCALFVACPTFPSVAADAPNRKVKVDDTIIVKVKVPADTTRVLIETLDTVSVEASMSEDKRDVTLKIKGLRVGIGQVLIDATLFYSVSVDVVAADPPVVKPEPPKEIPLPVVPFKRIPVEPTLVFPKEAPVVVPADPKPADTKPTVPVPVEPAKPVGNVSEGETDRETIEILKAEADRLRKERKSGSETHPIPLAVAFPVLVDDSLKCTTA